MLAAAIFPSRGAAFGLGEVPPSAPVPGARFSGSVECRPQNRNEKKLMGSQYRTQNGHAQTNRAHNNNAIVIHPVLQGADQARSPEASLEEAVGLAKAIELEVVHAASVKVNRPQPATLLGSGTVAEIGKVIAEADERGETVDLVIIDHALSPVQQRNLEQSFETKVIDRTGLILEIFGDRARTREGQLQVELAALSYQRSRLVRSWTHLERQRGGFGFIGGPGESQLEIDRRLIDGRIVKLKKELEEVRRTRGLHRKARARVPYPVVALVGYTNAGKSTLFNQLSGAKAFAKDLLFATLDPAMRAIESADRRQGDPVRYGGLHLRPADPSGGRVPRHPGRGAGRRHHPSCPRHRASGHGSAEGRR